MATAAIVEVVSEAELPPGRSLAGGQLLGCVDLVPFAAFVGTATIARVVAIRWVARIGVVGVSVVVAGTAASFDAIVEFVLAGQKVADSMAWP